MFGGMHMDINLPACPVETTLMLIGDKWKVLILRDLMLRYKAFWRTQKINRLCITKGINCPAS